MKDSQLHRPLTRAAAALALAAAITACSSSLVGPAEGVSLQLQSIGGVKFLTQNVVPSSTMEALHEGPVVLDDAGCLRLGGPDGSTVIWPLGFTALVGATGISIRDREGATVGVIGESFRLGGGVVRELLDSLGFTQSDRELAASACPGDYWIVQ